MNNELKNYWDNEERLKKVERELNKKEEKVKEVKKEITLNLDNYTNSNKSFNKQSETIKTEFNFKKNNYNKNENEKYKPKHLIAQIILNSLLFLCLYYYDSYSFLFIMVLNFCLIWIYSLISILKNDFKKDSNKTVWLIALIFLPFITPYIYPDFKEIQTIKD